MLGSIGMMIIHYVGMWGAVAPHLVVRIDRLDPIERKGDRRVLTACLLVK